LILRCVETATDKSTQPPSSVGMTVSTTRGQLTTALYAEAKAQEVAHHMSTAKGSESLGWTTTTSTTNKHTLVNALLMQGKTAAATKTLNGTIICRIVDELGNAITSGVPDGNGGYQVEPTDDTREWFRIYIGCTLCTSNAYNVISQPPTLGAFNHHLKRHLKGGQYLSTTSSEQSAQILAASLQGPLKKVLPDWKRKIAIEGGHSSSKHPRTDRLKIGEWRKDHLLFIQELFCLERNAYILSIAFFAFRSNRKADETVFVALKVLKVNTTTIKAKFTATIKELNIDTKKN
jgi:hypothetical protein